MHYAYLSVIREFAPLTAKKYPLNQIRRDNNKGETIMVANILLKKVGDDHRILGVYTENVRKEMVRGFAELSHELNPTWKAHPNIQGKIGLKTAGLKWDVMVPMGNYQVAVENGEPVYLLLHEGIYCDIECRGIYTAEAKAAQLAIYTDEGRAKNTADIQTAESKLAELRLQARDAGKNQAALNSSPAKKKNRRQAEKATAELKNRVARLEAMLEEMRAKTDEQLCQMVMADKHIYFEEYYVLDQFSEADLAEPENF